MRYSLRQVTGRHPRTADRFRTFLAKNGLLRLLGLFVAGVVAIAALIGLAYWLTSSQHSFWFWWRQSLLALAGGPAAPGLDLADTSFHAILQMVTAVLAVILPGLALGMIVFKAFVGRDIFTVRKHLSLMNAAQVRGAAREQLDEFECGDQCLAIRLYSSTRLNLDDVRFWLTARIRTRNAEGIRSVANHGLKLCKASWPIALRHVPYTLYVPLRDDDVYKHPESETLQLVGIQGHALGEQCDLLLQISGSVPELNQQFFEAHWFEAPSAVSNDPYGEIDVDHDQPSLAWKGWDKFG